MKYKATVNFLGFIPGEIVEIPENNDLPESFFTNGFLVPLEDKPKIQKEKGTKKNKVEHTKTVLLDTNKDKNTSTPLKSDKLD